jgi:hypothetical protein
VYRGASLHEGGRSVDIRGGRKRRAGVLRIWLRKWNGFKVIES